MARRDYSCNTTFLDLLFNMLLAYVGLFVLAFALSSIAKTDAPDEANSKMLGEFVIELEWDRESDDDIDLWVEGPGGLVYYQQREMGNMYLDRDDVGRRNEAVKTETGVIEIKNNREVVVIRSLVPGEYVVNVFAYTLRGPARPMNANVIVTRLKPWSVVTAKQIPLNADGDEKTVIRFTVESNGTVTGINDLPKILSRKVP